MSYKDLISEFDSDEFAAMCHHRISLWINIDVKLCNELIELVCENYPPIIFFEIINEYNLLDRNNNKLMDNLMRKCYYDFKMSDSTSFVFILESLGFNYKDIIFFVSNFMKITYYTIKNEVVIRLFNLLSNYGLSFTETEFYDVCLFKKAVCETDILNYMIDHEVSIEFIIGIIEQIKNDGEYIPTNTLNTIILRYDEITKDNIMLLLTVCATFYDISHDVIDKIIDIRLEYDNVILEKIFSSCNTYFFSAIHNIMPVEIEHYVLHNKKWIDDNLMDYIIKNNILEL